MESPFYVPGGQPPNQNTDAPEMPPPPTRGELIRAARDKYLRDRSRLALLLLRPVAAGIAFLVLAFIGIFIALLNNDHRPETKSVIVRSNVFKSVRIDGRPIEFNVLTAKQVQHFPRSRDSRTGYLKPIELLYPTEIDGDIRRITIRGSYPLLIKGSATEVYIALQGQQLLLIAGDLSGAHTPSWVDTGGTVRIGGNVNGGVTLYGSEITYGGEVNSRTSVLEMDVPGRKHVGPWNGRKAALQWPD